MGNQLAIVSMIVLITAIVGCTTQSPYHKTPLGDPSAYDAHFPDMDLNEDGRLDRTEFRRQFPKSNDHVFKALDLNGDNAIDHDEWHEFKEAHGMRHHS